MNKIWILLFATLFALPISCSKPQTEAEKSAEVERQVQERLAAERQAQETAASPAEQELNVATTQETEETETAGSRRAAPRRQVPDDSDEESSASYGTFYNRLEPHGSWFETEDYGYVYQPRDAEASRDWRPYTEGRWAYTDAGWTWVSDEPHGWATYHYGRWTRLQNVGWVWVPGNEWAPAWVSWRRSDDYVGWAPLPPEARFDRRKGIHNWSDNYYDIGPTQYAFVSVENLGARRLRESVVPLEQNVTIINRTKNVTNITYSNTTIVNQGPNYDELRGRSRQPIERLRLERRTDEDVYEGRPVVQGEVLTLAAPVIEFRAQQPRRPRQVRRTIATVEVDRGWSAIADRSGAEQARAKMRSEATPPQDLPPKTFRRSVERADAPPAAASPVAEATAAPATPPVAPAAAASPMATAAPARETRPAVTTATPETMATPDTSGSPAMAHPGAAAGDQSKSEQMAERRRMLKEAAKARNLEEHRVPMPDRAKRSLPSPLGSPASASPAEGAATPAIKRGVAADSEFTPAPRPASTAPPATATPAAATSVPSPSPEISPTPSPGEPGKGKGKGRGKGKGKGRDGEPEGEPTQPPGKQPR